MKINFTPGPSQLFFTVQDHIRRALRENVGSLSHRGKDFETIFLEATQGLKELLSIPKDFHIFFIGSASEVWERSIQNLVKMNSFHWINGSFSKRFYEIAVQSGKKPAMTEVPPGSGFDGPVALPADTELMAITHNETSTGVVLSLDFIHRLRDENKNSLLIVDAVSSLPFPSFDYSKIDSIFFSVQKGFGLPAGLGVWIVNENCIAKARALLSKGVPIGSYHSLPNLLIHAQKNQTPETPNVLGIYLLAKVVHDMLRYGIERIRKETEYKAALLYQALEHNPYLKPFVQEKKYQSKTVIAVDCGEHLAKVSEILVKKGMLPGDGYGPFKKNQLRFANFPAHSKEQFEMLVDTLDSLKL